MKHTNKATFADYRFEPSSPLGLTAIAAILHLAVFAGKVSPRRMPNRPAMHLVWQQPAKCRIDSERTEDKVPSNPIHTYCAGHLALAHGMAVVSLAAWMQIMHISGARGQ